MAAPGKLNRSKVQCSSLVPPISLCFSVTVAVSLRARALTSPLLLTFYVNLLLLSAINSADAQRYAEMGAGVACLFSQPIANTSTRLEMNTTTQKIEWQLPSTIGAPKNISIVLREDQTAGQLVGNYSLWCGAVPCKMGSLGVNGSIIPAYQYPPNGSLIPFGLQSGIGHKRILLLQHSTDFDSITLKIETQFKSRGGKQPALRDIFLFDWGGKVTQCV